MVGSQPASFYNNVQVSPSTATPPVGNSGWTDQNGNINWGNVIGSGAGALTGILGGNAASGAQQQGEQNAINTQTGLQQQLGSIYGAQRGAGDAAFGSLGSQLGLNGTPNYAAFNNSPGFQFAMDLGDQGIKRAASANGSLYTPNELAMLSQYNTGYASQNYNNYIQQLLSTAGLGAQGNSGLSSGLTQTSGNISQLQQNQGNAGAQGAINTSGVVSNLLNKVPWGQIGNGISSLMTPSNPQDGAGFVSGGGPGGSDYSPYVSMPNTGPNGSGVDPSTGMPMDSSGNIDWGFGGDYSNPP